MHTLLFSILITQAGHATGAHVRALQCQAGLAVARAQGRVPAPLAITGDETFDRTVNVAVPLLLQTQDQTPVLEVAFAVGDFMRGGYSAFDERRLLALATHRVSDYVRAVVTLRLHEATHAANLDTMWFMDQSAVHSRSAPRDEPIRQLGTQMLLDVRRIIDEIQDDLG